MCRRFVCTVHRYHTVRRRGARGTTPYPCEVVQAQIMLAKHDFINFSLTFLSQCMVVARDVPMGSPLLTCAESPSLVWTLVLRLVASHNSVREDGLPVFLADLYPFYPPGSNVQLLLSIMWMATEAFSCVSGFRARTMPAHVLVHVPTTSLATISTLCRSERPTTTPFNWATHTTMLSQPMTGR